MIRCYQCGTENLDGSEYCDECGKRLTSARNQLTPVPSELTSGTGPPPPPKFISETVIPKPATPYTPPPPPPPVYPGIRIGGQSPGRPEMQLPEQVAMPGPHQGGGAGSLTLQPNGQPNGQPTDARQTISDLTESIGQMAGSRRAVNPEPEAGPQAVLVILRGGKLGKEFAIGGSESLIGRWDADSGIFPDVDLDQDDPEAKISRRHARILLVNNQYLIEDLGSTNGTFINRGPRLTPGSRQPLNSGDEIIVGKTFLKFTVN